VISTAKLKMNMFGSQDEEGETLTCRLMWSCTELENLHDASIIYGLCSAVAQHLQWVLMWFVLNFKKTIVWVSFLYSRFHVAKTQLNGYRTRGASLSKLEDVGQGMQPWSLKKLTFCTFL
jgi:hypothetical protein